MIIVLEGVDGVGKSSVANTLANRLPLSNLLKLSGAPSGNDDNKDWMRNTYSSLLPFLIEVGNKSHIIMDRSWVSEYVYSPIFKNYTADYTMAFATRLNNSVDVRYMFLFADSESLQERIKKKEKFQPNEKHPSMDLRNKIQFSYRMAYYTMMSSGLNVSQIDTSDIDSDKVCDIILRSLELPSVFEDTYS